MMIMMMKTVLNDSFFLNILLFFGFHSFNMQLTIWPLRS